MVRRFYRTRRRIRVLTEQPLDHVFAVERLCRRQSGRHALARRGWTRRQPFEEALGQRAALRRELAGGGANVRAELPHGVARESDLLDLVQRLLVVIEQRRRRRPGPCASRPPCADAESQRTPSGRPRAADTAIIDDVSKTDRSCRAAVCFMLRPDVGDGLAGRQAAPAAALVRLREWPATPRAARPRRAAAY